MKTNMKTLLAIAFVVLSFVSYSQNVNDIKLNSDKVKKFQPYVEFRHGGKEAFNTWKENNKVQYVKEMWYFSESFYVKRNAFSEGVTLDESIIDISRFEDKRKANEEVILQLPGFKDALVLLPLSKLIYKHSDNTNSTK